MPVDEDTRMRVGASIDVIIGIEKKCAVVAVVALTGTSKTWVRFHDTSGDIPSRGATSNVPNQVFSEVAWTRGYYCFARGTTH